MIDDNSIKQKLDNFEFTSYAKATTKLLSAYGIVESTIRKITEGIDRGEEGPFYVYRRAIIFCSNDPEYKNKVKTTFGSVPLVIILHPNTVYLNHTYKGERTCLYSELKDHTEFLQPLISWDINKKDHYSTLELDQLVESLYRALKMDDNSDEESRITIFNILYIAHFSRLLNLNVIKNTLARADISDKEKVQSIFHYFSSSNCKFIRYNLDALRLSKESLSYFFAILRFDTRHIDAEILTSLIYRMADSEEAGIYGHQTSFVNVEKVLQPLFLDRMQRVAEASENETVFKIINDILNTTIFDPTNGPGCFLTASYNGLLQQLNDIERSFNLRVGRFLDINNFIAVVDNPLTEELTRLSLSFTHLKELSRNKTLDFDDINDVYDNLNIHVKDSLLSDWSEYVSPNENTYIVGSPKFRGSHKITTSEKEKMQHVYKSDRLFSADYSSAWLIKAAKFIRGSEAKAAFVLTNSVSQGEQSTFIYDNVRKNGCEYFFAYRSFKWSNSNRDNTGVTVVIIGIESVGGNSPKSIYDNGNCFPCKEIGCHLIPDADIKVEGRMKVLTSFLPPMRKGNMPYCANALIFSTENMEIFINEYPESKKYFRALYGSDEFVNSSPRWCLWITNKTLAEAKKIQGIAERIEKVREERAKTRATLKCKNNPHMFREHYCTSKGKVSIFVPTVTSENRDYFQMGIIDDRTIANNNSFVIYDCDIWLLALLESRMHTIWAKNACGGHETRPRYSNTLGYNTFPVPQIEPGQKHHLRELSKLLLQTREKYCDRSIGEMYTKMPPELKNVHILIDRYVDSIYQSKPFENDGERLICMKNLYNKLLANG